MGGDSAAIFCHFWSHSGGEIFEVIFLFLKVFAFGDPVELFAPLIHFIISLFPFKPILTSVANPRPILAALCTWVRYILAACWAPVFSTGILLQSTPILSLSVTFANPVVKVTAMPCHREWRLY